MDLSVIIVSFNTKKLLADCIRSLRKHTKSLEYEIIVVDNNSQDGSVELAESYTGSIRVIKNKKNLGFSKANNQGIKAARGKYILLLNSDSYLLGDSLGFMVEWMDRNPAVGIASCRLKNTDGSLQANGGYFPTIGRILLWSTFLDDIPLFSGKSYHPAPNVSIFQYEHFQDWVMGAFFMIRREVIKQIGGLDEKIFMYGEELEYCYRANQAGWKVAYVPATSIVHIGRGSGSSEKAILGEYKGLIYFYTRHLSLLEKIILEAMLKVGALLRIALYTAKGRLDFVKIYAKALAIS